MTMGLSRASLPALALAAAAGCTGSTDFEIERTFRIQGSGAVSASSDVDLADIADEAWDQRDRIDDVRITSAVATVIAVGPANTAPTGTVHAEVSRGSGAAHESAEVLDGSAAIGVGARVVGQQLEPASAIVKRAIEGDGLLSIEIVAAVPDGTTADFTTEVVLRVEADWSLW